MDDQIFLFIVQVQESIAESVIQKIEAATPDVVRLIIEEQDVLSDLNALYKLHKAANDKYDYMSLSQRKRWKSLRHCLANTIDCARERREARRNRKSA